MAVAFETVDPRTGKLLRTFGASTPAELRAALDASAAAARPLAAQSVEERCATLANLGTLLKAEAPRLGRLATEEMGKPLAQAVKEVEKCATACQYYAEQAPAQLADLPIKTEAKKSYVAFRPLGPLLCVMPWNFPYWQVIRMAAPAMAVGNPVLLKHAENTTGVALEIERLFLQAGFARGVLQVIRADHEALKGVIADPVVRAVTLTGSERAGTEVAKAAGAALKKSVLELGGSDPYIVLADADVAAAAQACVEARLVNNGQSCVAAKRFIVEAKAHDAFVDAFVEIAKKKRLGDPLTTDADVGPLAKAGIRDGVEKQVAESLAKGARALIGGKRRADLGGGWWYDITVLADVAPGMPAFDEEVFGPAAAIIRAKDERQAVELANRSRYGLGGAIFSKDVARAERLAARELEAGFTVVNGGVVSDARLPFGGVKLSGYGRELGPFGLKEFVNVKTVVVN